TRSLGVGTDRTPTLTLPQKGRGIVGDGSRMHDPGRLAGCHPRPRCEGGIGGVDGAAVAADRKRPMELLLHVVFSLGWQIDTPGELLIEGEGVDEWPGPAKKNRVDVVAGRVGDAVTADAIHRFVGLALVGDNLRRER